MADYYPHNIDTIPDYVCSRPEIQPILDVTDGLSVEEIGDGNLNQVFAVRSHSDPRQSIVLKQALPWLRAVGESWPLSTDRARIEALAIASAGQHAPEHTPQCHFYDPAMQVIAMQNLDSHMTLRKGLIAAVEYPHLADHLGCFLARSLGYTSDLVLNSRTKKERVAQFINPELCQMTEDYVFTIPFYQSDDNHYHAQLEPPVRALQADDALRSEVAQMKERFMTQAQALIHGDLHTGSVMVNQHDSRVIDFEFTFYGPMSFDIGSLIANFWLNYAAQTVRIGDDRARRRYHHYLTDSVIRIWQVFECEFEVIWAQTNPITMPPDYRQGYMKRLLQDTSGMAACEILRRVIGYSGVEDIRGIVDVDQRTTAARLALNIGQALLMQRHELNRIEELVEIASACQP